jgi:hypothetical protein
VWVFALGYVAGERVFSNERRLLAIESGNQDPPGNWIAAFLPGLHRP